MSSIADSFYVLFGLKTDQKSIKAAEAAVDAFGGKLKAVAAGAAAVLAPAALFATIKAGVEETATLADAQIKAARTVGITTEAFQELTFAASLSGVQQEQLRKGIMLTNKASQEAARGNQDLAKTYRMIGLNAREMSKLSPDEQFTRLVGALKGVEDKGKRAAIATKLLGEEGSVFASLIEGGVEGLNAARAEAQSRGLILSTKDSENAELFNDSMDRLRKTGQGLKQQLYIGLLPAIQEVLQVFLDFQKEGLLGSREGMKKLGEQMRMLIRQSVPVIKALLRLYKDTGGLTGALKLLFIAVASVAGAKGLMALTKAANGAMLANLKLALSTAAAAAPYVLLALAIAAVLIALDDLRGWIEGEESLLGEVFGEYNADTLKDIQGALIGIGIVLAILLGGSLGLVAVLALMAAALFVFWDDLGLMFEEFFLYLIEGWNKWVERLKDDWNEAVKDFKQAWKSMVDGLGQMWDDFVAMVLKGVDKIMGPIRTAKGLIGDGFDIVSNIAGEGVANVRSTARTLNHMGAELVGRDTRIEQRNEITIPINGSGLSPQQLRGAVADGVDDGLLRTINAGYEGSEI